jgi:hypothetical protein
MTTVQPESSTPTSAAKEWPAVKETEIVAHDTSTEAALDAKAGSADSLFSQSFTFSIQDDISELSSVYTNNEEEHSIPRPRISSNVDISNTISSTKLQSECLRPIIAGTYNDLPAYLLRLQFQLQVPGSDRSWLSRIQMASISVVFEDAPENTDQPKPKRKAMGKARDINCPAIAKVYPGPAGWEGPITPEQLSTEIGVNLQAGWAPAGVSAGAHWNHARSRENTGRAKVTTLITGRQVNQLVIEITENPVDAHGIPSYLLFPLIITHKSRRFSMRVTVRATFGFWRGKLANAVPVLGRADEPLYFHPEVLAEKMELGEKGEFGIHIVESAGALEDIDLQKYTSLGGNQN